jgi:hypothetical protein
MADVSRTEKSSKKKKKKIHHAPFPEGSAPIRPRAICSTIALISPVNPNERRWTN